MMPKQPQLPSCDLPPSNNQQRTGKKMKKV